MLTSLVSQRRHWVDRLSGRMELQTNRGQKPLFGKFFIFLFLAVKNLTLRTNKCQVKANSRRRLQVCDIKDQIKVRFLSFTFFSKANVSNLGISSDKYIPYLSVTEHVEEVSITWLLVWDHHPPVLIATNP